ncbi:hypothetical protein KKC17_03185 [Patescibacteria group bacterium]|nr:hypothetical protein [Patescibacteria group bacterium]
MINKFKEKGWRLMSQRQRLSPFPNYMSMEAMTGLVKEYVGENIDWLVLFFEDRIMNGFSPSKSFFASANDIVNRLENNPGIYADLIKKQNYWGKKLVKHAKLSFNKVDSTSTARDLYNFWMNFERIYKQVYATYGSVWMIEDVFNNRLLQIVKERISNEVKSVELLNLLTLQPKAMVARLEKQALLEVAVKIGIRSGWRQQVLKGNFKSFDKGLVALIVKHERDYFWVTRDYEDPILDKERIISKLKDVLRENYKTNLLAMKKELVKWRQQQDFLTKKLQLTNKEKKLFSAMQDVAYLKELRKHYVSESLYYFDRVLLEIGRRSCLSIKQVRFLKTEDLSSVLFSKKDFSKTINDRIKLSVWISHQGKTKVITGKKAEILKKKFIQKPKNLLEFIGTPVSPGKARGPVKIVLNPDECSKVKKGDIIVSIQVVPSFSAAIQRAAGLICDGGHGITTHPAILAREAKIPAIIQTRFAREVLKDGDIVEVDGYKGMARKIK